MVHSQLNSSKGIPMAKKNPDRRNAPIELFELEEMIKKLPADLRNKMLPLVERLKHYSRLHARLLNISQEKVDELELYNKYLQFDLEATSRELEEKIRKLEEDGE